MDSLRRSYVAFALIVVNTVLFLAIVESVGRLWNMIEQGARPYSDARANLSYYKSVPWGEAYWSEYTRSSEERYEPFVVWRRPPFAGRYINVDSAGLRRVPRQACAETATDVAVFGGSTVWGTGAPDHHTIPAQLHRLLNEARAGTYCVTNYGESGYVTAQEVITLLARLRRESRLDVAVFYDGINDVFAAYQNGRTDTHQNLAQIAARFEVGKKRSVAHRIEDWLYERSKAYQRIRRATLKDEERNDIGFTTGDSVLVRAAIENYLFNVDLIRRLGESYGFRTLFFWQPVMYTGHKRLVGEERRMVRQLDSRAVQFYKYAGGMLAAKADTSVVDLTHVFDDRQDMVWIDWAHITPEGNDIIARRIASHLLK